MTVDRTNDSTSGASAQDGGEHHPPVRQFVLRNRTTGQAVAVVEASSIPAAESLARLLQTVTPLLDKKLVFVAEHCASPLPLPTFRQGFFDILSSQSHSDSVN
jgi:hypothetical protein